MPLIDLSHVQLLHYSGGNPRPADFDDYWSAALSEFDRVDPAPNLRPSGPQVPERCFDVWFTGVVGGARLFAQYLRPATPGPPHPAVLHFQGYTMNSGDWFEKLGWPAMGFAYAALDVPGQREI